MPLPPELEALMASDNPFYSSSQPYATPPFNFPGMSPQSSSMAWMALEPLIRRFLPDTGFAPGFLFSHQNLMRQAQLRQDLFQQSQAQAMAHATDQARMMEMMRGVSRIMGTGFNDRFASMAVQDASPLMRTFAAVAPDAYESMLGWRGSSEIMARNMFLASRFMPDPVTGERRLSGDSLETLNRVFYDRFFGPGASSEAIHGLSAGRAAGLFNEMVGRGYAPPSLTRRQALEEMGRERPAELIEMSRVSGSATPDIAGAIDTLNRLTGNPEVDRALREFNGRRVADWFQNFNKTFSVIKDMMTDMGVSNASPAQMISLLNGLTQGGLSSMSPEMLTRQVARIHQMEQFGISTSATLQSIQYAASLTDRLGLNRTMAAQTGPLGLIYGRAYASVYGGVPGNMGPEHAAAYFVGAANEAASSAAAAQIATLTTLAEYAEGDERAGRGAMNPALRSYLSAIRGGGSTFVGADGRSRSVYFRNEADAIDFYRGAGGDPRLFQNVRMDRSTVADALRRYDTITPIVMGMRAELDVAPEISRIFGGMTTPASLAGLRGVIGDIAAGAFTREGGLRPGDLTSAPAATDALISHVLARVGPLSDEQRRDLGTHLRSAYSTMSSRFSAMGFLSPNQSIEQFLQGVSFNTREAADTMRRRNAFDTDLETSLSGLGHRSVLSRMVDLLDEPGGMAAGSAAGRVLGLIPTEAAQAALRDASRDIGRLRRRADEEFRRGDHAAASSTLAEIRDRVAYVSGLGLDSNLESLDDRLNEELYREHRRRDRRRGGPVRGISDIGLRAEGLVEDMFGSEAADAVSGAIGAFARPALEAIGAVGRAGRAAVNGTATAVRIVGEMRLSGTLHSEILGEMDLRDATIAPA